MSSTGLRHTIDCLQAARKFTFIVGKTIPTRKLASQLTSTAMDMAAGRGPWEKSSAVIIQGMEPGPTAKNTTKPSVDTTERYDIQSIISCT